MRDRIQNVIIPHLIAELRREGISGLVEYEERLQNNARNTDVLGDLLFEADAALMFRRNGFQVTIRERPDLLIDWGGEATYAEVKHFREKEQDKIDEQAMQKSEDLVLVGNTKPTEGSEAWEQIAEAAINKVEQYKEGAQNILVVATDSNCVNGQILSTAVQVFDERAESNPHLQRLNAFMLIDQWFEWVKELSTERNVHFHRTAHAELPMSQRLVDALVCIHRWSWCWSMPRNGLPPI